MTFQLFNRTIERTIGETLHSVAYYFLPMVLFFVPFFIKYILKSTWKKTILSAIIAFVLLAGSTFGIQFSINTYFSVFTESKWASHPYERKEMLGDLNRKYTLVGMSVEDAKNLLGKPIAESDFDMEYIIDEGWFDPEYLALEFADGKIYKTYTYTEIKPQRVMTDIPASPQKNGENNFSNNKLEINMSDDRIVIDGVPGSYNQETEVGMLRISKYDNAGVMLWRKEYSDLFTAIYMERIPFTRTKDGGFAAVVEPQDNGRKPNYHFSKTTGCLVRFDALGNIQWKAEHIRKSNPIGFIVEGDGGNILTYGWLYDEDGNFLPKSILQKYNTEGKLVLSRISEDSGWCGRAHYRENAGFILSAEGSLYCYNDSLDTVWQIKNKGILLGLSLFDDAIYWGGDGQSWEKAPLYKVSYEGKILWEKEFDGRAMPLPGGQALLVPEGEDAKGITLVDMETEKIIKPIEQLNNWHFRLINATPQQFTIEYFDGYYVHNSKIKIQVTYDNKGNIISQQ